MKTLTLLTLALTASVTLATASAQTTLTFEDAPDGGLSSYSGFAVTNAYVVSETVSLGNFAPTYVYPSPGKGIWNAQAWINETTFSLAGGSFDFLSGHFISWSYFPGYSGYSSRSVTLSGYSGSSLVGTRTYDLSPVAWTEVSPNFVGIDRLTITNSSYNTYWLGDSLKVANVNPVPEPASMAVLGLGLAALKRRRKA